MDVSLVAPLVRVSPVPPAPVRFISDSPDSLVHDPTLPIPSATISNVTTPSASPPLQPRPSRRSPSPKPLVLPEPSSSVSSDPISAFPRLSKQPVSSRSKSGAAPSSRGPDVSSRSSTTGATVAAEPAGDDREIDRDGGEQDEKAAFFGGSSSPGFQIWEDD